MSDSVFTAKSGSPLEVQLSFLARSAIIDNETNQFLYLPDSGRYVPPYSHNLIVPLPATQVGRVRFQTPPGITAPPVNTAESVVVTFTATALPPSSAQSAFTPGSPQNILNANQGPGTVVYTMPTGAVGIAVVALAGGVTSISATGVTSNFIYISQTVAQATSIAQASPIFAVDSQISVTVGGGSAAVIALYDLASVDVSGFGQGNSVVVSRGPVLSSLTNVAVLASGTTSPSFSGFLRFIRRVILSIDPATTAGGTAWKLVSADGSVTYAYGLARWPANATSMLPIVIEFDDIPLQPGVNGQYGLAVRNDSGGSTVQFIVTILGFVGNAAI